MRVFLKGEVTFERGVKILITLLHLFFFSLSLSLSLMLYSFCSYCVFFHTFSLPPILCLLFPPYLSLFLSLPSHNVNLYRIHIFSLPLNSLPYFSLLPYSPLLSALCCTLQTPPFPLTHASPSLSFPLFPSLWMSELTLFSLSFFCFNSVSLSLSLSPYHLFFP